MPRWFLSPVVSVTSVLYPILITKSSPNYTSRIVPNFEYTPICRIMWWLYYICTLTTWPRLLYIHITPCKYISLIMIYHMKQLCQSFLSSYPHRGLHVLCPLFLLVSSCWFLRLKHSIHLVNNLMCNVMRLWDPDLDFLKYSHGCSKTGFLTQYACFKGTQIPFAVAYCIILGIEI